MENGQSTVTINGNEKEITIPVSFATLRDLVLAARANDNPYRAFYAALGLCVQMRPKLGLVYQGDAIKYGGQVMDAMYQRARRTPRTSILARRCGSSTRRRSSAGLPVCRHICPKTRYPKLWIFPKRARGPRLSRDTYRAHVFTGSSRVL